jgi:hypothetical protein
MRTLTAAVLLAPFFLSGTAQADSPHTVTALRAYLYRQETGETDTTNLIAEGQNAPILWNTIIGEGPNGSPSAATLILGA